MKKCVVCEEQAFLRIKDTSDYYCKECAEDNFEDISVLLRISDENISAGLQEEP